MVAGAALGWLLISTLWSFLIYRHAVTVPEARVLKFLAEPTPPLTTWRALWAFVKRACGYHMLAVVATVVYAVWVPPTIPLLLGTDLLILMICWLAIPAAYRLEHGRYTLMDAFILLPQCGFWGWAHWTMLVAERV